MKRVGFVLATSGLALIISGIIGIVKTDGNEPLPYFLLMGGFVFLFLGISFLFFNQPIEKRKKSANRILVIGLISFGLTYFAGTLHLPGVSIAAVTVCSYLSFTYLPLLTKNRVEKWKNFTRKTWHAFLLSIGDLVSLSALILGFLFKKLHWPGANWMLIIGVIVLAVSLIGWNQLFSKEIVLRKEAEDKAKEAFSKLKIQHEIIEEKNREILDSIRYAKRIQQALLPSDKFIESRLIKIKKKNKDKV